MHLSGARFEIMHPAAKTCTPGAGCTLRVAKFESKVGSRRKTKIENLVVLDIFLVALILIPYNMRFVLSSQNDICILEK